MATSSLSVEVKGTVLLVSDVTEYSGFKEKPVVLQKVILKMDSTKSDLVKLYNYNKEMFDIFEQGKKIVIPECKQQTNHYILYARQKAFRCGKKNVTEEEIQEAKECMEKPLFDFVSTDEIKKSPLKRRVSLAGKVVAGDMIGDTKSRRLTIDDSMGSVKVLLWSTAGQKDVNVGDNVRVLDGTVNFDHYSNTNTLNINRPDQIMKINDVEKEMLEILGINVKSGEVLVNRKTSGTCGSFAVELSMLLQAAQCSDADSLLEEIPITVNGCITGGKISF